MEGYEEAVADDPVPALLLYPDESSEEGEQEHETEQEEQETEQEEQETEKEEERPFKIDYVPLAVGEYTELPVAMAPTLEFGGNFFSRLLQPGDGRILFRALLQRCHGAEQLHQRHFVSLGPDGRPARDVKLPPGIRLDDFVASPPRDVLAPPKRWAVAIDCEMVGVAVSQPPAPQKEKLAASETTMAGRVGRGLPTTPARGGQGRDHGRRNARPAPTERSELGQLCAVDVLTGEVLVDVLVQPAGRVVNWRTRYSGLTPAAVRAARARGALAAGGWAEARARLLAHVDAATVLVGHALDNDLTVLRLAHGGRVVDTALQTAEAVYGAVDRFPRIWRLRDLVRDLAGLTVQAQGRGHSCLEDALATRELALWCLRFPRRLEAWAAAQRALLEAQAAERDARYQEKKKAAKDKRKQAAATEAEDDAADGLQNDGRNGNDKPKKRLRRKPKPGQAS